MELFEADDRVSTAIAECLRLFRLNDSENLPETILRLRSLQEISDGLATEVLIKLAAWVHAQADNGLEAQLDEALQAAGRFRDDRVA